MKYMMQNVNVGQENEKFNENICKFLQIETSTLSPFSAENMSLFFYKEIFMFIKQHY